MAWQKQKKFKSENPIDEEESPVLDNDAAFQEFMEDWKKIRDPHPGQQQVLDAVIVDGVKYTFYRSGRKGAKTTTGIDIAWILSHQFPKRVGYLCYPTIAQGIEVVWDEKRLQNCDIKDDFMFDKYVEKVDESKHMMWFKNGSFVKLVGTWTEKRGRGRQPDYMICDEFQDCNADYIEASDSDLAAKNAPCIFMGTPPKKRNHYEDWWDRISTNPKGKNFHFTSYDNVRLPHLKEWLDNKKIELLKAGKEDVWLREYMAEFCYASSDRVLPDAKFMETEEIEAKLRNFDFRERIPILAISVHPTYFNVVLAVLIRKKMIFIMDHLHVPQVWNRAFSDMYPELGEKLKKLQNSCANKIRNIVWDDSGSFSDIITGFSKCRDDQKWQDRGIPILRELMVKEKICFSREIADFGLECQNMLIEETPKEVQKNYPHICTMAMIVNEYFSLDKLTIPIQKPFDVYAGFREMGIPFTRPNKRRRFPF
jgi:hypothetical protein